VCIHRNKQTTICSQNTETDAWKWNGGMFGFWFTSLVDNSVLGSWTFDFSQVAILMDIKAVPIQGEMESIILIMCCEANTDITEKVFEHPEVQCVVAPFGSTKMRVNPFTMFGLRH
jgi:hypothetical protein